MAMFAQYEGDLVAALDAYTEETDESTAELLGAAELEARSLGAAEKKEARGRLKAYKARLEKLRHAAVTGGGGDESIFGGGGGGAGASADARSRMEAQTETLSRGTETLERLNRLVADTEEIAGGTIEQLAENRTTIESVQGNMGQVHATVDEAGGVLDRMTRRAKHWWRR